MPKLLCLALSACALLVCAPALTQADPPAQTNFVSPLLSAKTIQVTAAMIDNDFYSKALTHRSSRIFHFFMQPPKKSFGKVVMSLHGRHPHTILFVNNGKTTTNYDEQSNHSYQNASSSLDVVWSQMALAPPGTPASALLDKQKCLLFTQMQSDSIGAQHIQRIWIDAVTHLPVREQHTMTLHGKTRTTFQADYTEWKLNVPLPASTFVFVPPPGAKLVQDPTSTQPKGN